MSDRQLAQLICAWRLFSPTLDLSLSTRESAFRNGAVRLGITQMSAESRTQPVAMPRGTEELEQFAIHDDRPGKWPPPCGRRGCSRCSRTGNLLGR
jgi:2-iminoacetate synthase